MTPDEILSDQPDPSMSADSSPITPWLVEYLRKQGEHAIADLVVHRRGQGIERYGVELHSFNGRRALKDQAQELVDLIMYQAQELVEGDDKIVYDLNRAIDILKRVLYRMDR